MGAQAPLCRRRKAGERAGSGRLRQSSSYETNGLGYPSHGAMLRVTTDPIEPPTGVDGEWVQELRGEPVREGSDVVPCREVERTFREPHRDLFDRVSSR